jgi:hypothetical protein
MPHLNSRVLAYLALALPCFTITDGARAGVGGMGGEALSAFEDVSPVQTVQSGECWEQDGPDGPGYYPCGDGGVGGVILGPAVRRHHRHGGIASDPHATNPVYSGRVGAGGVPSAHLRSGGASVAGAAGVHAPPGLRHGAVPVSPGLAGAHEPGEAAGAHVGAAVSPSLAGVHAPGSAAIPHIGSPASPGVTAGAAPHIGAPVSPGWAGVHTPSAAAIPHIGAPVSPGLAGVHGVGGGGGIGRR